MTEQKSAGITTLGVIDPRMHPSEELYAILGLLTERSTYTKKKPKKAWKNI